MWITHERRAACGQTEEHPATPSEGGPGRIPLGPRRRADRCARAPQRATSDGYARGSPSGTSHHFRGGRRPGCQDPGLGHWARRRGPPALLALLRRRALSTTCMGYQHRRALYPPRGVNSPLTMSTTPSRCQQRAPVRGALEHPVLETRPPLTTHARAGRATALRAHWANPPVWCPSPPVTHTRTPIYETPDAHNGLIPPLCATPCFLIPFLVCDREERADNERAPRPMNPRPRQFQPRPRA